jgi:tetratricopeptide (TPR) repeat protein
MSTSNKNLKLITLLLIIGTIIFFANEQIEYSLKEPKNNNSRKLQHEEHIHEHDDKKSDHKSPENQKRMGIYHYNEGNKLLKENNTEEAIRNYKMALHHNQSFEEAYINLSSAYLSKKNFEIAIKTLNTLESINPKHPLLHYNFACYYSLLGNIPKGIQSLNLAISYGFKNYQKLKTDPDFDNLRNNQQFQKIQSLFSTKK